jgi:hypothetical protein
VARQQQAAGRKHGAATLAGESRQRARKLAALLRPAPAAGSKQQVVGRRSGCTPCLSSRPLLHSQGRLQPAAHPLSQCAWLGGLGVRGNALGCPVDLLDTQPTDRSGGPGSMPQAHQPRPAGPHPSSQPAPGTGQATAGHGRQQHTGAVAALCLRSTPATLPAAAHRLVPRRCTPTCLALESASPWGVDLRALTTTCRRIRLHITGTLAPQPARLTPATTVQRSGCRAAGSSAVLMRLAARSALAWSAAPPPSRLHLTVSIQQMPASPAVATAGSPCSQPATPHQPGRRPALGLVTAGSIKQQLPASASAPVPCSAGLLFAAPHYLLHTHLLGWRWHLLL